MNPSSNACSTASLSPTLSWPVDSRIQHTDPNDDYGNLKKIANGGYDGIYIYRAQRKHGRQQTVAIKMFQLSGLSPEEIAMLTEEAHKESQTLQRCNLPGVIKYFESYHYKDEFWIVMELCEGGSLREVMNKKAHVLQIKVDRKNRPPPGTKPIFTEEQISFIIKEVLMALDLLHRSKLVHRDIKAANTLLTQNGEVKLGDLGAAVHNSFSSKMMTSLVGTAFFVAPEILTGQYAGNKCDIWSVGIMALELAEFVPPLNELSWGEALTSIETLPAPTLAHPEEWSNDFDDFLRKCLVKEPDKRASAADLLNHPFVDRNFDKKCLKKFVMGDARTVAKDTAAKPGGLPAPPRSQVATSIAKTEGNEQCACCAIN